MIKKWSVFIIYTSNWSNILRKVYKEKAWFKCYRVIQKCQSGGRVNLEIQKLSHPNCDFCDLVLVSVNCNVSIMNIWIVQRVQKRIMLSSGPSYLNLRFLRDLREEMYDTFVNISNSVNPPKMTSNNENIVFRVTSVSSWKVQQFNIY